jgi:hypothetical protein
MDNSDLWNLQGEVAALRFLVRRLIAERCAAASDPAAENARWLALLEDYRKRHNAIAMVPHQSGKETVESTAAAAAAEQLIERLTKDPEARW